MFNKKGEKMDVQRTIDIARGQIKPSKSQLLAEAIYIDITDRKGLRQEIEQIDPPIIQAMKRRWVAIAEQIYEPGEAGLIDDGDDLPW